MSAAPFLADPDVTIWCGDALETLRELPDESVHMACTSPPFYGLRDYGTGSWEGGDPDCDHTPRRDDSKRARYTPGGSLKRGGDDFLASGVCKCGARRVDQQIGLESSPDEWVARLVEVFREVKRVLRHDGTLWLEIGDSYASSSLSMQRLRSDDRGTGTGEGSMSRLLLEHGAEALEGAEQGSSEGAGSGLPSSEPREAESPNHGAPAPNEGDDPGNPGSSVQLLRGSGAGLSDDRPRAERRRKGAEDGAAPDLQEDPGRGLPHGSVPDPLLELQLGQGNAGRLPPHKGVKPKDLIGSPWLLAFALRADGWYLRSEIIWSKPNPMPESVTDRPTVSHSRVFLLTKSARYFYDAEAVREDAIRAGDVPGGAWDRAGDGYVKPGWGNGAVPNGRNRRSVWTIPTEPYPEAHFATWPSRLVEPMILAGTSERGVCPECGAPWERQTEAEHDAEGRTTNGQKPRTTERRGFDVRMVKATSTVGWQPTCECYPISAPECMYAIPATVLDVFGGSGTTAAVARKHGRRAILIELNPDYCALAAKRLAQQSLLAVEA